MRKRLTITLLILLVISSIILFNNTISPLGPIQNFIQGIFSAPKSWIYRTQRHIFTSKKDEVAQLEEENKKLIGQMVDYKKIKEDNTALKSQMSLDEGASLKMIEASIVGYEGNNRRPGKLILDKGSEDGLKKNMTVVSEKNVVGKIGQVTPKFSTVIVPLSPEFSDVGKTIRANTEGIISGQQDFILYDHILITDNIQNGDIVVTKGSTAVDGTGLRPDLVVGKVKAVSRQETQPFQTAEIESLIDYSKLTNVFVILQ